MMETEGHARNWSFMIGPSSTVITNLSRKAISAIAGLMLFTIKRTNAIQTFLDMTAASASLATMANTRHRKNPDSQKFPQVVSRGEGSIHEVHQHVQVLHKQLCGDLTPYEEINKTVMANRDPTTLFHNISNYDLFVWIHYYMLHEAPFSYIT